MSLDIWEQSNKVLSVVWMVWSFSDYVLVMKTLMIVRMHSFDCTIITLHLCQE